MTLRNWILRAAAIVTTAGSLGVAPAIAQPVPGFRGELCGQSVTADHFLGDYRLTVGSGFVTNGQMRAPYAGSSSQVVVNQPDGSSVTLPMPNPRDLEAGGTVTLAIKNGRLILNDAAGTLAARVVSTDAPPWQWRSELGEPPVSADSLEAIGGCENDQLPRLRALGAGTSTDGSPISYRYRLVEVTPGKLVGVLDWQGNGFVSRRWVMLER